MAGNWVKINRKILDNPWLSKPAYFTVWLHILLSVAFEKTDVIFEGKRITLNPGQGLISCSEIGSRWGISVSTVWRVIKVFETENQIEIKRTYHKSLVTVVNWHLYQKVGKQNCNLIKSQCKASGKQVVSKTVPFQLIKDLKNEKKQKKGNVPDAETLGALSFYENNFRPLTSVVERDQVLDLVERFSSSWVCRAITETIKCGGGRNVKYITAILERWQHEGGPDAQKRRIVEAAKEAVETIKAPDINCPRCHGSGYYLSEDGSTMVECSCRKGGSDVPED